MIEDMFGRLVGQRGVKSILSVERLGQKKDKIRAVRVVLSNTDTKYEILSKAKDLSKIEEYKKVFVAPDLTRKQQEEDKKLRAKLKELREAGDAEVRIKKGKIIKNVDGTEMVIFPSPVGQM